MEKKKKLWQVLIPVLVALAVIVAFAISGTITRRADEAYGAHQGVCG